MKRTNAPAPILIAIAGVLSLTMLAFTAAPATAAGGAWRAKQAEDLLVKLTRCLRAGGYVTKTGKCKGYGKSIYAKPKPTIYRSYKIGARVALPWAKRSVKWQGRNSCWIGHSRYGSTVKSRFAKAGYKTRIKYGENMGCGLYGNGKKTVIKVVRMWQAERSWNGWHWRQIRDKEFRSLGVGVARYGSRKTQIVVNFYGKRIP